MTDIIKTKALKRLPYTIEQAEVRDHGHFVVHGIVKIVKVSSASSYFGLDDVFYYISDDVAVPDGASLFFLVATPDPIRWLITKGRTFYEADWTSPTPMRARKITAFGRCLGIVPYEEPQPISKLNAAAIRREIKKWRETRTDSRLET